MNLQILGSTIRLIRVNKNLSQENVAYDLNISITAYSKIERGKTNIPFMRLTQIATLFKLDVVSLLQYGDVKTEKYSENINITDILKKENTHLKELLNAKDEIILLLKQRSNNNTL